jgi:teichuronic acid biosynthesis glycosyltransferase TuaC
LGSNESYLTNRWPGRVLFVSPHTMFFIGDQFRSVEKLVREAHALIPSPLFASLALRLPFASNRFASLKRARESMRMNQRGSLLRARYFDIPGSFGRGVTSSLAAASSIRAISRAGLEFEVVHSHFIGLNGVIGRALKERFRKPLVVTAYGGDAYSLPFRDSYGRKLAVSIVKEADGLIAVSKPIAQILLNLGADQDKVRVIPTGYDRSVFRPVDKGEARSQLGLPASKRILLTVANLVPQKGLQYLLDGFAQISKSRPDLTLVIVGGGELDGDLRARAAGLGVKGSVLFAGRRPHEEVSMWMNACDVLVLSSVSEGSPTVLPEAMACGRPIVATTVGGIPDVVREGEVGYLVPPRDVKDLADAMVRALDRSWNEEGIMKHAIPFSWDSLANEIVKVYSELSGS